MLDASKEKKMIFEETYDHLFNQLAGIGDALATTRLHDYQRKRLRRALLARSIRPYLLEATWQIGTGLAGETNVALTKPVTTPLIVLDGAIRTANRVFVAGRNAQLGTQSDFNNFELQITRAGGDSRVQMAQGFIKDEHLLVPALAAIKQYISNGRLGQGAPYPITWPVPLRLAPNELLQVQSRILLGGIPAERHTFTQFRAVSVDNKAEDDAFIRELQEDIKIRPIQRPVFLSMASENAKSIAFPATGTLQRTTAKTRETPEHLLVLGYSVQLARATNFGTIDNAGGTFASPKWRLQASNGYSFSREEIDMQCYGYAGPGFFYSEFAHPFLLPKGSSLAASFSTLDTIASAQEQIDNYVFFRCVTV